MKKNELMFLVIGLVGGALIGFVVATSMNPGVARNKEYAKPSAGDYGAEQYADAPMPMQSQADEQAANKARIMSEIKQLRDVLNADANNLDVLIKLGNNYFDVGDHYASIEMYEKALAVNPNMPDVIVDLGIMYREAGKSDKALAQFSKALEINPAHQNAHLNKAVVYKYDLKDYEKAIESFNQFLQLIPANDHRGDEVRGEIAALKEEMKKGKTATETKK